MRLRRRVFLGAVAGAQADVDDVTWYTNPIRHNSTETAFRGKADIATWLFFEAALCS